MTSTTMNVYYVVGNSMHKVTGNVETLMKFFESAPSAKLSIHNASPAIKSSISGVKTANQLVSALSNTKYNTRRTCNTCGMYA